MAWDSSSLNVKTRFSGSVRVGIQASSGGSTGSETTGNEAIARFALADSVPITGDHIDAPLAWEGEAALAALRGQTIRLHVELFKADLYAIRF